MSIGLKGVMRLLIVRNYKHLPKVSAKNQLFCNFAAAKIEMTDSRSDIKTNSRGTKFLKDIGIYAIGNIGSKIITFLMVPLYTYFIHDTSDFGYYDLCLTVCLLLMPFVTLQLRDGAFRFLLDCDDETQRQRIVTFVTRTMATTLSVAAIIALAMSLFTSIHYLGYVFGLLAAMSLQEVYSQVFRGLNNNRAFVAVGILSALGIGLFSILFVAWLGWGIKGIFLHIEGCFNYSGIPNLCHSHVFSDQIQFLPQERKVLIAHVDIPEIIGEIKQHLLHALRFTHLHQVIH